MLEGASKQVVMHVLVRKPDAASEFMTPERCRILEVWNDSSDPHLSIARATVAPGVTTQRHRLRGVDERYLIVEGQGVIQLGDLAAEPVIAGNVAVIPA